MFQRIVCFRSVIDLGLPWFSYPVMLRLWNRSPALYAWFVKWSRQLESQGSAPGTTRQGKEALTSHTLGREHKPHSRAWLEIVPQLIPNHYPEVQPQPRSTGNQPGHLFSYYQGNRPVLAIHHQNDLSTWKSYHAMPLIKPPASPCLSRTQGGACDLASTHFFSFICHSSSRTPPCTHKHTLSLR